MDKNESRSSVSQTVWLDEKARTASFHCVAGCEERSFHCLDYFMGFLNSLQERGDLHPGHRHELCHAVYL